MTASLLAAALVGAATWTLATSPRSISSHVVRDRASRSRSRWQVTLPAFADRLMRRAGVEPDPALVAAWVQAAALCTVLAAVVPALRIVAAAVICAPPIGLLALGDRGARRRREQLPIALDAIAAGLRSGQALAGSIGSAASVGSPLGAELAAVADGIRSGRTTLEALDGWQRGIDDPDTDLAIAALTVAATVGGPGARAVDNAAASLRDRHAVQAELSALATQGKASAAVLTLAPVCFAFLLSMVDPGASSFLFGTPAGWLCLFLGGALDALGAWWMARIVRGAR